MQPALTEASVNKLREPLQPSLYSIRPYKGAESLARLPGSSQYFPSLASFAACPSPAAMYRLA